MRVALVGTETPIWERYCPNMQGQKQAMRLMDKVEEYTFIDCRKEGRWANDVIKFNPDLVVYLLMDAPLNNVDALKVRKELPNTKIVLWYADLRDERTGRVPKIDFTDRLDRFFVTNDGQHEFWKDKVGLEGEYLPLGCKIVPGIEYDEKYDYDVVFIGGMYDGALSRRTELIKEIMKEVDVKLINEEDVKKRAMVYKNMPKIYCSSKISLDISNFWDIPGYTSNRGFIIPMYKGFSLTKKFPGCEKLFKEDKYKVYFNTAKEAISKIKYYLNHKAEREKIRIQGHDHAVKNHNFIKRYNKMFKKLNLK